MFARLPGMQAMHALVGCHRRCRKTRALSFQSALIVRSDSLAERVGFEPTSRENP